MSHFFISLYEFFQARKLFFYSILLVMFGTSLWTASKLTLEEDISKVIPSDEKMEKLNEVLKNSSFSDQVIMTFSLKDTSLSKPDELVKATQFFSDLLINKEEFKPYVKELSKQITDQKISEGFDFFYTHLPYFLSKQDYQSIDSVLEANRFDKKMDQAYKTLISPASLFLKKSIIRDPLNLTPMAFKKVQGLQVDDHFTMYENCIITSDYKNTMLLFRPSEQAKESNETSVFIDLLDKSLQEYQKNNPRIQITYFGGLAVANANVVQIKEDVFLTVTIAAIGLILLLGFFFRSKSVFFILFLPVVLAGTLALAFVFIFKTSVSAISLGVGSVILGVTIDFSLHVISHYQFTKSVHQLLKNISTPLIVSSLTTCSAFFCLLLLQSEALNDLGLFAGMSVLFASILSLIVLPQLLSLKKNSTPQKNNLFDWLASYAFDKNKWIVIPVVLFIAFSSYFSQQVSFEQDMMKINYMPKHLAEAEKHLNELTSASLKSIYIVSTGDNLEEALKINEKNHPSIEQLKKDEIITSYASVTDLYFSQEKQKEKLKQWNSFWTIEKKAKIKELLISNSERLGFKKGTFDSFNEIIEQKYTSVSSDEFSLIKSMFLEDYIIEGKDNVSIVTLLKLDRKNQEKVHLAFTEKPNTLVFDKQNITTKLIDMIRQDFDFLVKMCFGLVFIILLISYGRIELALVAFLPIMLSWLCTLGLMSIFGLTFNIVNIIISTFIFGLGIDYSIFITQGLIEEYKYGKRELSFYKTSILLSVFTTILGVGVLIFAKHPVLQSIALLSIIGLVSVISISFTIQPLLFNFLMYSKGEKRKTPVSLVQIGRTIVIYSYFLSGVLFLSIIGFILFYLTPISKKPKQAIFHKIVQNCSKFLLTIFSAKDFIKNSHQEKFDKPAIIIANHQSFIDILMMIMLSPKVIIMTKDWVWESKIFGHIVRWLEYFPASYGNEEGLKHIEKKTEEGYSVVIFPEGTRSETTEMKRFHKGAFFLAEQLNLDILPIVLHGTGDCIRKNELFLNKVQFSVSILKRIGIEDKNYGENYSERTKKISKFFKSEYVKFCQEKETVNYYYPLIAQNYIYKGPILEWYFKVKVALEKRYQYFNDILPKEGRIVDIGCGYGFLAYFLTSLNRQREVLGVDYDEEKITVAQQNGIKTERVNFISGDATKVDFGKADAFLMCDILHYLPIEKQNELIEKCIHNLNEGGSLIIREGDKELGEKKHKGTKITELFSTKILGFNKNEHELTFFSRQQLIDITTKYQLKLEIIDQTKFTSNVIFIVKK